MLLHPLINKKTVLLGVFALSLAVGGVALSGSLLRGQKGAKDVDVDMMSDVANITTVSQVEHTHAKMAIDKKVINAQTSAIHYVSVHDAHLDSSQKDKVLAQIHRLESTGSTSGGILTTEFKSATHAKMSYRFGRRQPLAFDMVDIKEALPAGFVLTGRAYEGVLSAKGFDGVYRLFENPNSKARLEITETYIHPDKPLILIKELYREDMEGTPLRFEQLIDKKGEVYYHGEFVAGDRYVSMTSRGMNLPEFMTIIDVIQTNTAQLV